MGAKVKCTFRRNQPHVENPCFRSTWSLFDSWLWRLHFARSVEITHHNFLLQSISKSTFMTFFPALFLSPPSLSLDFIGLTLGLQKSRDTCCTIKVLYSVKSIPGYSKDISHDTIITKKACCPFLRVCVFRSSEASLEYVLVLFSGTQVNNAKMQGVTENVYISRKFF